MNEHVPLINIIKGWKGNRTLGKNTPLPSQLRKLLKDLEQDGFIERIFNQRKFTAIRLNFDHTLIKNASYFNLTKKITSDNRLGLDEICIAAMYARYDYLNVKYSTKLSSILGIDRGTFATNILKLQACGYLLKETSKHTQWNIATYSLKQPFVIRCFQRKTFSESMNQSRRDDFSPLRYYFINKIKNNITMLGIMYKEMNKKGKSLNEYLTMTEDELSMMVNAVQMNLVTMGEPQSKMVVRARITRFLLQSSKSDKVRFLNDHRFYTYVTKSLSRKNKTFDFEPTTKEFLYNLSKELPFNIPMWRLKSEVNTVVEEGFKFKNEIHALNFLKARFDLMDLSLKIKERDLQHRKDEYKTNELHIPKVSTIGDILAKLKKSDN